MPTYPFRGAEPRLGSEVFLAPGSRVIGDVELGEGTSVWFNAVLRGDVAPLQIGPGCNIQDNSVVHADPGFPTSLGAYVTVGHNAILHGCTIGDETLIGMGATVLNGAVIEEQCLIGAGALIPEGKRIPAGSVVMGVPGKVIRQLTPEERAGFRRHAEHYQALAATYNA